MAESDIAKAERVIVIQRVYRNEELARWIEEHFGEGLPRTMAWTLAFKIGEMYPEVSDKIRGDLIDVDIQEE